MEEIKQRLESELNHTMNRIRQMGGAVVLEEFPAAVGDNTPLADEVDVIRQNEDREMSFATRSLLVGARQQAGGGACSGCAAASTACARSAARRSRPARLRVMPEVTTCVRCQDRIERMLHRLKFVGGGSTATSPTTTDR